LAIDFLTGRRVAAPKDFCFFLSSKKKNSFLGLAENAGNTNRTDFPSQGANYAVLTEKKIHAKTVGLSAALAASPIIGS